mmetsp:Transcript_20964/g.54676  ORF Transcript_20964/g.54676 Transcript_20964/m.54676 type:complete len:201 (+) Transcript_20964:369-971(+)
MMPAPCWCQAQGQRMQEVLPMRGKPQLHKVVMTWWWCQAQEQEEGPTQAQLLLQRLQQQQRMWRMLQLHRMMMMRPCCRMLEQEESPTRVQLLSLRRQQILPALLTCSCSWRVQGGRRRWCPGSRQTRRRGKRGRGEGMRCYRSSSSSSGGGVSCCSKSLNRNLIPLRAGRGANTRSNKNSSSSSSSSSSRRAKEGGRAQ